MRQVGTGMVKVIGGGNDDGNAALQGFESEDVGAFAVDSGGSDLLDVREAEHIAKEFLGKCKNRRGVWLLPQYL